MNCSGGDFDPTSQGLTKPDERRSHLRWDATASGVAVVFRGCCARAALSDLSLGGMAVQYTPAGPGLPAAGVCDLISGKADADLPRSIQLRTVYDIAALAEGLSFSGETIRRRGFQFRGMAARQRRQIRALFEGTLSASTEGHASNDRTEMEWNPYPVVMAALFFMSSHFGMIFPRHYESRIRT